MKTHHYNKQYFQERDLLDQLTAGALVTFLKQNGAHTVLDVGCGTGRLVKYLNGLKFHAFGCDSEPEALKLAKKLNNQRVIKRGSATDLPYPDQTFDAVSLISVIEHLNRKQVQKFLTEAGRVLKPYGLLFLLTPNWATPLRLLQGKRWFGYSDPTHITFFSKKTLIPFLRRHGFTNTQTGFAVPLDVPSDLDFSPILQRLPQPLKKVLVWALYSTLLSTMRNGLLLGAYYNPPNFRCNICQQQKTKPLFKVVRENKQSFWFQECESCKLITLYPTPHQTYRTLYTYKEAVNHNSQVNPQFNYFLKFPGGKKIFNAYNWWCNALRFRLILKYVTPGKLLDVGCGDGIFLNFFHSPRWKTSGIEINPYQAKKARQKTGSKILRQTIEQAKLPQSAFDIVTTWHVLEHLTKPKTVLQKVRRALKPGGYLLLEVPHGQAWYRKIFGPHWQLLMPPQHLYLWSLPSLKQTLQAGGFKIVKVAYHGRLSFSGASSFANWLRAKQVPPKMAVIMAFLIFPLTLLINLFAGSNRENLFVVARKI